MAFAESCSLGDEEIGELAALEEELAPSHIISGDLFAEPRKESLLRLALSLSLGM
jgi:hypothetical protein